MRLIMKKLSRGKIIILSGRGSYKQPLQFRDILLLKIRTINIRINSSLSAIRIPTFAV